MRSFFFVLLAIQLSLVLSQITFTREWVAGKRSSGNPSSNIITFQDENPACISLWPAIAYLLEVEKQRESTVNLRELQCGPGPKSNTFLGKIFDGYRKTMDKRSMDKTDSATSHHFDEDSSMKSR